MNGGRGWRIWELLKKLKSSSEVAGLAMGYDVQMELGEEDRREVTHGNFSMFTSYLNQSWNLHEDVD